jgi:hypothetical protein
MEIPAEVQLVIEREVEKAKSKAREEAEKARNQAIGVLAFGVVLLTIASGLGVSQMIKTYSSSAAEQAVKTSMGKEFLVKAERAALEAENYSFRAKRSLNEIEEVNRQAIGRLDPQRCQVILERGA